MGENETQNRLRMLVGLSDSDLVEFRLYLSVSGFVTGAVIWLDSSRSGQITMRSRRDLARSRLDLAGSGLDLDKILLDLVRFQVIFHWRTPNTVGFCKFSLKILQISPEVFGF